MMTTFHIDDTIAAIASPAGGGARGIVRVSGPDVFQCIEQCFAADHPRIWNELRLAETHAGTFLLDNSQRLPCQMYLWPTARSYTRQPMFEMHTVGSPPLLNWMLRRVCETGVRLAGPGEFTMRAFLAGRIDLPQAEAVLGIIDAVDQRELQLALAQLAGGVSIALSELRNDLLNMLADIEAGLDFVEDDIEFVSSAEVHLRLARATDQVEAIVQQIRTRNIERHQLRVVLTGLPNAGKSSLLNQLCQEPAAIVSPQAGTTRDYVTKSLVFEGLPIELIDTAGIEASDSATLEASAQRLSDAQAEQCDLEVLCIDGSQPCCEATDLLLERSRSVPRIVTLTKSDLPWRDRISIVSAIRTSSSTGQGVAELQSAIVAALAADTRPPAVLIPATATRCQESLRQAAHSLARARELAFSGRGEELLAAEIRLALDQLGAVVGAVYTDDILDRIFSRFCIGK